MQKYPNSTVFKVAALDGQEVWCNPCSIHGFKRRKDCKYPGFGPEIVDFLLDYLHIPYEIIPVNKTTPFGSFESQSALV